MADDPFGGALSSGPLSDILGDYTSDKLFSKSRITKAERDQHELQKIKQKEQQIKKRKNLKRKKLDKQDLENYVLPRKVAKKMKYSNPSQYHKYIKKLNKDIDDNDIDIEIQTKQFTKSILLGTVEQNKKLLNSLDYPNKINNNSANSSNINNNNDNDNDDDNENNLDNIPLSYKQLTDQQVIKRFRELRQPIRYFGEDDDDRLKRLRNLEIIEHERQEGASKGLQNEFTKSIKNEVEKELEAAMAQSMNQNKNNGNNENKLESTRNQIKKTKYDKPRQRSSFARSEDFVLFFFKRMLREWEQQLLNRSENEKQSRYGKNATMLQKQARRDIRALFKQLKNRTVPRDVLQKSEKMVFAAEKRNYVEAKRIFFEMAIGNAPWPMGVTMVGIHERSGRSKIFSSQIAHVMNDEIQRKYIHAMARLISFCQEKYPNNDPTRNMG